MSVNLRGIAYEQAREIVCRAVNEFLVRSLSEQPSSLVRKVAEYAVLSGGQRWRPLVAVASGLIFDPDPLPLVMPGACGIELAHSASLVLDDLPSMDDAAIRRSKPCPHLVFERWAVDLAPVFMITLAYRLSLGNNRVAHDRRIQMAIAMSIAGLDMVAGQEIDMDNPDKSLNPKTLTECYNQKCASLYAAAALTGALSVGVDHADATKLFQCGLNLGLAYQFLDDVADVIAADNRSLKTAGRDSNKLTAVDFYGLAGARSKIYEFRDAALAELEGYGAEANMLRKIIRSAIWQA
jgi:geranylgeranyl diphosphate synthase type II